MTSCDLNTSIPDWVIEHPKTLAVFQELDIDDSCGGKSLTYACRERGLGAELVLAKLHSCLDDESSTDKDVSNKDLRDGDSSCAARRSR